ncbi:hypothetical protein like AT5G50890 [Hibiscus trionum]|uniref:Uncharacterized protein n=1 Tax=Hibiscus trionum TaxID=183268 RepID=A0A9W7LN50_HIBTR|nr:hypothetical protein like AT5G50890 [Hibiscus trionum]
MILRNIGEKATLAWNLLKTMLPLSSEPQGSNDEEIEDDSFSLKNWLGHIYGEKNSVGLKKWVPRLYVNNTDYICCRYTDPEGVEEKDVEKMNIVPMDAHVAAKFFVVSKPGKQKFLEAHGLEQWWSDELYLHLALNESKLISRQLKSLYIVPATQQTQGRPR